MGNDFHSYIAVEGTIYKLETIPKNKSSNQWDTGMIQYNWGYLMVTMAGHDFFSRFLKGV